MWYLGKELLTGVAGDDSLQEALNFVLSEAGKGARRNRTRCRADAPPARINPLRSSIGCNFEYSN
jgi:hypothetical protein